MPNPLLTIRGAAEFCSVSPDTIRRRLDAGKLRCLRLGDGPKAPIRIQLADLLEFAGLGESHSPRHGSTKQISNERARLAERLGMKAD